MTVATGIQRFALTVAVAATAIGLAGCNSTARSEPKPASQKVSIASVSGNFVPPTASNPEPTAVSYNTTSAPLSARMTVTVRRLPGGTQISLSVTGLLPQHDYSAHVHTHACGPNPSDSGPHYQNVRAPQTPTVDPKYANPANEVWLDWTTDANGSAEATTTVNWRFRPNEAHALVLHPNRTATHAGHAGTSGERVACLNVKDLEAAWVA